jgi:ribose transport system substrate-binding protein
MKFGKLLVAAVALVTASVSAIAQDVGIDNAGRNAFLNAVKGKRVVYIPMTMQADNTIAWNKMLQRQAKELGYTVDVRDANWSTEAGARALTAAIAEKADLIVLLNPDAQSYAKLIRQASDANIKVIQLNMESLQKSDAYVGADMVGIGYTAGKEVAARCAAGKGRSTKVQIVVGVPTSAADLYQVFGFRKAIADHPEIQIVSQQAANYDPTKARAITASVLQQHPDLCASFGIWDAMDAGIGAAVKEAGQQGKVFVVTSGGGAHTSCQKISDGTFSMLIAYDIRNQGAALNEMVTSLLQSKARANANPVAYFTPNRLITKVNMTSASCWSMDELL